LIAGFAFELAEPNHSLPNNIKPKQYSRL